LELEEVVDLVVEGGNLAQNGVTLLQLK